MELRLVVLSTETSLGKCGGVGRTGWHQKVQSSKDTRGVTPKWKIWLKKKYFSKTFRIVSLKKKKHHNNVVYMSLCGAININYLEKNKYKNQENKMHVYHINTTRPVANLNYSDDFI